MKRTLQRVAVAVALTVGLGGTALAQGYWYYPPPSGPPPSYNVTPNGNGWQIQQNPNPQMIVPRYVVPAVPPQMPNMSSGGRYAPLPIPQTPVIPQAPPPIFLR